MAAFFSHLGGWSEAVLGSGGGCLYSPSSGVPLTLLLFPRSRPRTLVSAFCHSHSSDGLQPLACSWRKTFCEGPVAVAMGRQVCGVEETGLIPILSWEGSQRDEKGFGYVQVGVLTLETSHSFHGFS